MKTFAATVVSRRTLSAHLVSITLEVEGDLASTDVPDEYLRVLIPPAGAELALPVIGDDYSWTYPEGAVEATPRVYTVSDHRVVDGRRQIDVDVALHDVGVGSDWAREATVGSRVGLTEPHGLYAAPADVARHLLVCDVTGIPALARILRGLGSQQHAAVHVVLTDPRDEVALPSAADTTVTWTVVEDERHVEDALTAAVVDHDLDGLGYVWMAGEARASRAVRKHLRRTLGWPQSSFYTCGYWQLDAEKWNARYEQVADTVNAEAVAAYEQLAEKDQGAYLDQLEDIYDRAGL